MSKGGGLPHLLRSQGVTRPASLPLGKPEREDWWPEQVAEKDPRKTQSWRGLLLHQQIGTSKQEALHPAPALLPARHFHCLQSLNLTQGEKSKWCYFSICR